MIASPALLSRKLIEKAVKAIEVRTRPTPKIGRVLVLAEAATD